MALIDVPVVVDVGALADRTAIAVVAGGRLRSAHILLLLDAVGTSLAVGAPSVQSFGDAIRELRVAMERRPETPPPLERPKYALARASRGRYAISGRPSVSTPLRQFDAAQRDSRRLSRQRYIRQQRGVFRNRGLSR